MNHSVKSLLLLSVVCFTFSSCKDNGNNNDDLAGNVEGVWQLDSDEGDVLYIDISTEAVASYDYMGDSFDEGDDCYEIDISDIVEKDGNIYTITNPEFPGSEFEATLELNGNKLTVSMQFMGGNLVEVYTKSNAQTSSFTPECVEENPASTSPKAKTGMRIF